MAALDRFAPLYEAAMARRFSERLGIKPVGVDQAKLLVGAAEKQMRETGMGPDAFFFTHRGGRHADTAGEFGDMLSRLSPVEGALDHPIWAETAPPSMLIDEVEAIWSAIDTKDDWQALTEKIGAIRKLGTALCGPTG